MDPRRIFGWVLVSIGLTLGMSAGRNSMNERAKAQLEGRVEDPNVMVWRSLGGACPCLAFLVPGVLLLLIARSPGNPYIR